MKKSQQHTIDFLFSISIFFVFSAVAVLVLLLSSNIYTNVVSHSERNFEIATTLSYITEKVRQNDDCNSQNIYLSQFAECEALAISQNYDGVTYITYIYEQNGALKEVFVQDGVAVADSAGTTIMEVDSLEMFQISDDLLRITCTPKNGTAASTFINIHSEGN